MAKQYSDDELAFLSPEERAGVAMDMEATDAAKKGAAEEGDDKEADDKDDEPPAKEAKEEKPEKEEKPAKEAKPEAGEDPLAKIEPLPVLPTTDDKRDYAKERTDLKAYLAEQRRLFNDGEMTQDAFDQIVDAVGDKRDALTRDETLSLARREDTTSVLDRTWAQDQAEFFRDNAEWNKGARRDALEAAFNRLEAQSGGYKLNGLQLLEAARDAVLADLGVVQKGSARPKPQSEADVLSRFAKKAPKTLADVPNAQDAEGGEEGKFASLDRLMDSDPEAFEVALARLSVQSPSEYDQYLRQST